MGLQDGWVVVQHGQLVSHIAEEGVGTARVVDIVADWGDQQRDKVRRIQALLHTVATAEVRGRLEHVRSMGGVVVGVGGAVVGLDRTEPVTKRSLVDLQEVEDPELYQDVKPKVEQRPETRDGYRMVKVKIHDYEDVSN